MLGVMIAGVILFVVLAVIAICFLKRLWGVLTLSFVSAQFDEVDRKGAREELRKMKTSGKDITLYLGDDTTKTQMFLQFVYALNRIGAGIRKGTLSRGIIFEAWSPQWFVENWKAFEPLIKKERERRKIENLYNSFEWLSKECSKGK